MKKVKFLFPAIFGLALFVSCSDDDHDHPEHSHEEEVITTVTVTLTPSSGTEVTLEWQDLDGDGPNDPTITGGKLASNTVYDGVIKLLNETETPAEDITEEVEEEADEHQFFYTVSSGLNVTTAYSDTDVDGDGNPVGLEFTLTTGEASSGTVTFTLRHEPTKPNTGLEDAGGSTDVEATFNIEVE